MFIYTFFLYMGSVERVKKLPNIVVVKFAFT